MSTLKLYIKAASVSVLSKFFISFGALAVVWQLNVLAGKDGFGLIMLAFALNYLLAMTAASYFQSLILYHVARDADNAHDNERRLGFYFSWLLVLAPLMSVVELALTPHIATAMGKPEAAQWFAAMAWIIPAFACNALLSNFYKAQQKIGDFVVFFEVMPMAIRLIGFMIMIVLGLPADLAAAVFIASYALPFIVLWARRPIMPNLDFSYASAWDFSYGTKTMLAQFANKSINNLVVFILGFFVSAGAIADLSVAVRFSQFLQMPKLALVQLHKPRIGQWFAKGDREALLVEYRGVQVISLAGTLVGCIAFLFLAELALSLFGDYESALPLLFMLAAASVVRAAFGAAGEYIGMAGRANQALGVNILILGSVAGVIVALVPAVGIVGAAAALVIGALIGMVVSAGFIWRDDRFSCVNWGLLGSAGIASYGLATFSLELMGLPACLLCLVAGLAMLAPQARPLFSSYTKGYK
ncbi:MAG: lipopolysaccharide biosynthesis protein [Alphaproteobacteria bacterium]